MDYLKKVKSRQGFEILFGGTVLFSFLLWVIFIFAGGAAGKQFDIFFARCVNFIADSSNVTGYSAWLDPYNNTINGLGEKAYPPLTYVMMYLISRVTDASAYTKNFVSMYTDPKFLIMYMIFTTIAVVMLYTLLRTIKKGTELAKNMTAAAICLSAPFIFTFERGNTILFTAILCTFFFFYSDSKNKVMKELALMSLAVAAAFKMTPAVLGIVLLYRKQFKEAVRTAIYGVIAVFGPFIFLHGGFSNIPLMFQNMTMNLNAYTSIEGCTLTASVFHFGSLFDSSYEMSQSAMNLMKNVTYVISGLLLVLAPFYRQYWKKVAAAVMVLLILPSHSGYYCTMYLIPVIILFLNEEQHRNVDFVYLIAFILIGWDFVSDIQPWLNYNVAIPIIVIALLIEAFVDVIYVITDKIYKRA